jgi:hypothetical protein
MKRRGVGEGEGAGPREVGSGGKSRGQGQGKYVCGDRCPPGGAQIYRGLVEGIVFRGRRGRGETHRKMAEIAVNKDLQRAPREPDGGYRCWWWGVISEGWGSADLGFSQADEAGVARAGPPRDNPLGGREVGGARRAAARRRVADRRGAWWRDAGPIGEADGVMECPGGVRIGVGAGGGLWGFGGAVVPRQRL